MKISTMAFEIYRQVWKTIAESSPMYNPLTSILLMLAPWTLRLGKPNRTLSGSMHLNIYGSQRPKDSHMHYFSDCIMFVFYFPVAIWNLRYNHLQWHLQQLEIISIKENALVYKMWSILFYVPPTKSVIKQLLFLSLLKANIWNVKVICADLYNMLIVLPQ